MKKNLIIISILVLLAGLTESCKKDECTGKITISYQTLEAFGGIYCGIIIN